MRAKDLCQALDLGLEPKHIEGMRSKLKRLVARGLIVETEPGLGSGEEPGLFEGSETSPTMCMVAGARRRVRQDASVVISGEAVEEGEIFESAHDPAADYSGFGATTGFTGITGVAFSLAAVAVSQPFHMARQRRTGEHRGDRAHPDPPEAAEGLRPEP